MTDRNWESLIDGLQAFMLGVLVITVAVSILCLILFDTLAGTGVMLYLTKENVGISLAISFATSGLLMSLMFLVQTTFSKNKKVSVGTGLLFLGALAVGALDVYFDCLTADYLRFGQIISLSVLPETDVHVLYRSLLGGLSTLGEPLAIAILLGLPVLKNLISGALPNKSTAKPKSNKEHHWKSQRNAARKREEADRQQKILLKGSSQTFHRVK